jgi:hypothetical protein
MHFQQRTHVNQLHARHFFFTHTVAVCFESTCVKTMAECQTLERDGERVTELEFE